VKLNNWTITTLGEITEINPTLNKSLYKNDLLVSFVPMSSVEALTGKVKVTDTKSFSEVKKGYTYFQTGDVLFAKITPCMENGKMAVVPPVKNGVAFGSTEFHVFRPHKNVDPWYLYYFISSERFRNDAEHNMTGAVGQRRVPSVYLKNHCIFLPPLNEQKRIVAIIEELFSELDNGLENLQKTQEALKIYRQSLLKSAFEGKLTKKWRNHNKNKFNNIEELRSFIQLERNKCYEHVVEKWEFDSKFGKKSQKPRQPKILNFITENELNDLPVLPDTWVWDKLGWMTLGVEYGTSAKSAKKGDVAVLRMGNIQNCIFTWDDLVFTSEKDEIEKYYLNCGDVLFNRTNSPEHVGKTALYRGEYQAIFAGYLIRINQINSIVNDQYLNLYLNSPLAKQQGNKVKTDGVNQSNINGEKLINYPFPYCSLEEQEIIVSILEKYFLCIDSIENEIQSSLLKLNAMRQSILKKAFSGELAPQDSHDEPANELLEKIKTEQAIQNNPKRTSRKQKVAK
jgi:type I restriction enzyme S subunit